jgi:hypothetical protein
MIKLAIYGAVSLLPTNGMTPLLIPTYEKSLERILPFFPSHIEESVIFLFSAI